MLKEFLSQKGVAFEERDISVNPDYAHEMVRNTGQRGVPVTLIDGQVIVGFDRPRLEQALMQKRDQLPSFGVAVADAGKITAQRGGEIIYGAFIGKVKPGTTSEKIGLAPGDIIVRFNTLRVSDAAEFERALHNFRRGGRFTIEFRRGNQTLTAEGTL